MIHGNYCKIAGKPISKNKKSNCAYCIRITEKKYLCEETLEWVSTCCSDGCYCSSMCNLWMLSNGFCVFHSKMTPCHGYKYHTTEIFISEDFYRHTVIKLKGRTFKDLALLSKENNIMPLGSKVENIAVIYNDALGKAAHMHFVLREIFHLHQ